MLDDSSRIRKRSIIGTFMEIVQESLHAPEDSQTARVNLLWAPSVPVFTLLTLSCEYFQGSSILLGSGQARILDRADRSERADYLSI